MQSFCIHNVHLIKYVFVDVVQKTVDNWVILDRCRSLSGNVYIQGFYFCSNANSKGHKTKGSKIYSGPAYIKMRK